MLSRYIVAFTSLKIHSKYLSHFAVKTFQLKDELTNQFNVTFFLSCTIQDFLMCSVFRFSLSFLNLVQPVLGEGMFSVNMSSCRIIMRAVPGNL